MAPSARTWAVSKLKALNFEGDADALGQYVDALIENNRETENGDPTLLRKQVTADLNDFLEPPSAKEFVDALMKHLSPDSPPAPAPKPTAEKALPRSAANDQRLMGALGDRMATTPEKVVRREERKEPNETERPTPRERPAERERRPERERAPRNERNERNDRMDRTDRRDRVDRKDRGVPLNQRKPNIIDRLGDRMDDRERRPPNERDPVALPNQNWELWDDRQRRNQQQIRRGEKLVDLRDRLGNRAKRPREDDAERDAKFSRRTDAKEREPRKRNNEEMQGITRAGGRPEDVKPPGPWPPEMMGRLPMMPPPLPFGMMPPPPMMGVHARGGRGVGRGREGRDRGGRGGAAQSSRHKHFILIAKFIPEDKMMMGPIYAYFQRFGTMRDVHRVMPDKALILFSRREEAQLAMNSVDAVMGNRHIKLFWARDQDFSEAGMTLGDDGTLQPAEQGSTTPAKPTAQRDFGADKSGKNMVQQRREQEAAEREAQAKLAAEEKERQMKEAEEDLKKKKEQIAALRKEQDQRKADQQAKYDSLIAKQKKLMIEIHASKDAQEKMTLMGQWKVALAEAEKVLAELKPKAKAQPPATARPARRSISSFKVDNRPKNVLISNAKPELTQELVVAVFRETERAEHVQGGWLLSFSTRWAAESALRAVGPLKRGFGPQATAQIVTMTMPESSSPVVNANASAPSSVVKPVEVHPQTIAE